VAHIPRIKSLELSLIEAEIFFDEHGNAEVMEKSKFATRTLSGTSGICYWKATDEEIDILRRNGCTLPDWRDLGVADIAEQHPNWAPESQEQNV
jgi:hypothetical protein